MRTSYFHPFFTGDAFNLVYLIAFYPTAALRQIPGIGGVRKNGVDHAGSPHRIVIRELTRPLFSIPVHQFIFNGGNVDKKFFMDNLQLEESEYALIRDPQRGSCLYKCGNERYLLQVRAPEYKRALFGTAGGR